MFSIVLVKQFEFKDAWTDFVINNIPAQGNNVKIKMNLKVEWICRDCSLNFLLDKCHCTRFLFSIIRGIIITVTFFKKSQRHNIVGYFRKVFHWVQNTSLIIKGFFYYSQLRLLLGLFREFWLAFHLSISSRNLLCRCN